MFINYIEKAADFQIIDIDKNDQYKEIVILEAGFEELYPNFIRYTGDELIHLGNLSGDFYLDQRGRIVTINTVYQFTEPEICSGYFTVSNNKLVFQAYDIEQFENRDYTIKQDIEVIFVESKEAPKSTEPGSMWTMDTLELKKGDRLRINKIGVKPIEGEIIWLNVTFESGQSGNVYVSYIS